MADDLDDLLRRTMKTLDDQVPSGYFEDLPTRTLARLEGPMELDSDRSASGSAPATGVPREEDSGLHDIRNLAASTKMRISSQRISSPNIDDVASSSGGWKAVAALPEPARMISLPEPEPDERPSKKELRRVAKATEPARALPVSEVATPIGAHIAAKRPQAPAAKRRGFLAVAGVGLAAAAGVTIFVATRDRSDNAARAVEETKGAPPPAIGGAQQQIATDRGAEINAAGAKPDKAGQGTPEGVAAGSNAAPATVDAAVVVPSFDTKPDDKKTDLPTKTPPPPPVDKKPTVKGKDSSLSKPRPEPVGKKVKGGKADTDVKTDSEIKKVDTGKKVETVKEPGKKVEKKGDAIDDLLNDAGGKEPKKDTPKLEKKALSADDFKQGMAGISGRAAACYQHTTGTVPVRVSVSPNGHVARVVVSGPFASTPEGACVQAAVQGATFPAWDGAPQSYGYSFLLQEK